MTKSVSIVGCGWFGLPLAKAFVEVGFDVRGSKRTAAKARLLQQEGIMGFHLDLDDKETFDSRTLSRTTSLLDSDYLVVNVPPGFRQDPHGYLRRLTRLKECISDCQYQRIIFISSTGVYPAKDQVVTEKDAIMHSASSENLLAAEQVFRDIAPTCVLRFAGLVGPKRHPGRFLSGKTDISGGAAPVNLVHLNDCISAVVQVITAKNVGPVYNLCAFEHPSREQLYQAASLHLNLLKPLFNEVEVAGKKVDASLITRELGFQYQFNNPIDMLDYC
ncbi:SDR family oxidoreductase [uncultured Shewanella sp.]|uniref:SDR family oxidoreductase n=1 Tax=uncultured Shewanella sp. TaxID=173975 RepID=UPI002625C579|nr:SDR family oxidoreductase [uncultured Shewanella sp.]